MKGIKKFNFILGLITISISFHSTAQMSNQKSTNAMNKIKPFKIEIDQRVLNDLQVRLKQTRWTDEPKDAGWSYGTNPAYLRELVTYWQQKYDWRKHESQLNTFAQFKTEIDGIGIHFIHVKGKGPNAKPLLLTHGWPDSFYRFYKVIPMLTDPARHGGDPAQSFDVIVPSIPGFGFSDLRALTVSQTAELWAKLMTDVLGYKTFYAAGGDLGAEITRSLATSRPDIVAAIHLTDVGYPTGAEDWSTMSPGEQEFGKFLEHWWLTEGAFNMIQSTKPQTLGYGLNDSPVGLASWVLEKFNTWSDSKGNIESRFTKDELLTNIMIYWVTQTINTSIRTYAEGQRAAFATWGQPEKRAEVPAAVAVFPAEPPMPREWAERRVNVKRFTKMPEGGHFAAMEVPALFVNDVRTFFASVESKK